MLFQRLAFPENLSLKHIAASIPFRIFLYLPVKFLYKNDHLHAFCLVIMLGSLLFSFGCKDNGPGPDPPAGPPQILEVTAEPDPVPVEDTTIFTCIIDDSLNEAYNFSWQLSQSDGSIQDTVTDTHMYHWAAPADTGTYAHSVSVVQEELTDPPTRSFSVTVMTEGPEPPPNPQITGINISPNPVMSGDTTTFRCQLADSLDPRYQYTWKLQQPNGPTEEHVSNSNTYKWGAPSAAGDYQHSVTVTDTGGQASPASRSFSVTVESIDPSDTTISGKLVFSAKDAQGAYQIFTMNANGTGMQQLTDWEEDAMYPDWHPEGDQIIFSSFKQGISDGPALWIMDADGSNKHLLYDPEPDNIHVPPLVGNNPRWSPDGTKVVYDVCLNCAIVTNYDIFVFDTTSRESTQLTDDLASDRLPAWSPDGNRIAFQSNRDYVNATDDRWRKDIYAINLAGSGVERLTTTGNAIKPSWSPSGQLIAYEWNIRGNEVFLYDMSNESITKVETGMEFSANPIWNNTGTSLLVAGRQTSSSAPELRFVYTKYSQFKVIKVIPLNSMNNAKNFDWYEE